MIKDIKQCLKLLSDKMKIELNAGYRSGWRIYDIEPTNEDLDKAEKLKVKLIKMIYDDIVKFGELKRARKAFLKKKK